MISYHLTKQRAVVIAALTMLNAMASAVIRTGLRSLVGGDSD